MIKIAVKGFVFAVAVFGAGLLRAAPTNDAFSAPAVLTGFPVAGGGSNIAATLEAGEPVPDVAAQASVWYRWTAPTSGPVQVDTFGSGFDTILAVWTGATLATLSEVIANDDYLASESAVLFSAVSGTTYRIAVYGYADARGSVALHVTNDMTSTISGTVTGPGGVTPLPGIQAAAYRQNGASWDYMRNAYTDGSGHFAISGLPAGTYRIEFNDVPDGNYIPEVYNDVANFDDGQAIILPATSTVSGVNASLAVASRIQGTVTGPDGLTLLEGIEVTAYRWSGSWWSGVAWINTDANGEYSLGGLPAGTYRVGFQDLAHGDYISEAYDDVATVDAGADIVLAATSTVSGIDASLAAAAKIHGRITGPDGSTPLPDIEATAYWWNGIDWESSNWAFSDTNGDYVIGGLSADTYRVRFWDGNGNYITEFYDDAAQVESAQDIDLVSQVAAFGVDASLADASKISGTVTGPDGLTPLADVDVEVYGWNGVAWDLRRSGSTDAAGAYSVGGLTAGTYRVMFSDWFHALHLSEAYDDAPDLASATDIVLPALTDLTGIDASLALRPPDPPVVVAVRPLGFNGYDVRFTGTVSRVYVLQEATTLTGAWIDVSAPSLCLAGTNSIPRTSSVSRVYWRLKTLP